VGQDKLSLLSVSVLALLLEVGVLLLQNFLLSFELSPHVINLTVSICLNCFEIFLQSVSLLLDPLKSLLKATSL